VWVRCGCETELLLDYMAVLTLGLLEQLRQRTEHIRGWPGNVEIAP